MNMDIVVAEQMLTVGVVNHLSIQHSFRFYTNLFKFPSYFTCCPRGSFVLEDFLKFSPRCIVQETALIVFHVAWQLMSVVCE